MRLSATCTISSETRCSRPSSDAITLFDRSRCVSSVNQAGVTDDRQLQLRSSLRRHGPRRSRFSTAEISLCERLSTESERKDPQISSMRSGEIRRMSICPQDACVRRESAVPHAGGQIGKRAREVWCTLVCRRKLWGKISVLRWANFSPFQRLGRRSIMKPEERRPASSFLEDSRQLAETWRSQSRSSHPWPFRPPPCAHPCACTLRPHHPPWQSFRPSSPT